MTSNAKAPKQSSVYRMVLVSDLHIDIQAQRKLNPVWVKQKAPDFDVDNLGYIVVNIRADGRMFVVDGQHRTDLMRAVGWGDQKIHAEVFQGLSLQEEADLFLARNDRRAIRHYDSFRIAVTAGHPMESAIANIVKAEGLLISDQTRDGHITAVSALEKVYLGANKADAKLGRVALQNTIRVLLGAWGNKKLAFNGELLLGMGLVQLRYPTELDQTGLSNKLAPFKGGPAGLLGAARALKDLKRRPVAHCVASIIVDQYNSGRRSHKLGNWE